MSITENEALASLRILVAIARADGTVHNDERKSLAAAIESLQSTDEGGSGFSLPSGLTLEKLLGETVDVEAQLRELQSPEAREQIYRSAYFMAYADGTCTKEEQAILDRIAVATDPSAEQRNSLDRIFTGRATTKGVDPGISLTTTKIDDPTERAAEVNKRALRYSVLTAALGAFPIPGLAIATDLAVIAVQLKLIRDIGGLWGHVVDAKAAKSILYGVGLGTGARLAVNNLAKLLPGWGSVIGATTSFVSTYALAKTIEKLYEQGKDAPGSDAEADALRANFRANEEQARALYADQKDVIIESRRHNQGTFDELTAKLKAGQITQEEFDAKVAALV